MKGGFLEIPKTLSSQLDVFVRLAREEFLRMIDLGWYAQHRGTALCIDTTPSYSVAGTFLTIIVWASACWAMLFVIYSFAG